MELVFPMPPFALEDATLFLLDMVSLGSDIYGQMYVWKECSKKGGGLDRDVGIGFEARSTEKLE
jgi:hypothetical protein